jgi:hypothetical protein
MKLSLVSFAIAFASANVAAEPILHEFIPAQPNKEDDWARRGQLPEKIKNGDRQLERPDPREGKKRDERVIGRNANTTRKTSTRLDRTTTHDGTLNYAAEFNPSVVPFKRMTAFDQIRADFSLTIKDPAKVALPLFSRPTPPTHDAFWGSVILESKRGVPLPLPSVAPDANIVSYKTHPASEARFFRDSAGNFWVSVQTDGRFRLTFLTDTPRTFFSAQIPPLLKLADIPSGMRPNVPNRVRDDARRLIDHIGIDRRQSLRRILLKLTSYFRNFRARALASGSGNTYLDIGLSQSGVCRHRSMGFVITAQTLGIPAHYVTNEAHAFTEVFVPRLGWIRIDLGGASSQLRVANAGQKEVHQPGPDPFPRPHRFAAGYSQLQGQVSGIPTQSAAGGRPGQRGSRRRGRTFDQQFGAARTGNRGGRTGPGSTPGRVPPTKEDYVVAGPPGTGESRDPDTGKQATRILLSSPAKQVFRGDPLRISGRVEGAKRGISGLKIQIALSQDGESIAASLAPTISGRGGHFSVQRNVPKTLPVGVYEVYVMTPGNGEYEGSISQ